MKIEILKKIKKISVLALSGLVVLSAGFGFMAMDKKGEEAAGLIAEDKREQEGIENG